jgi:glutaredoxin
MEMKHVPGKNKGTLVLYALSTCIWCKKMKQLLDDLGLEYSYVYVDMLDETDEQEALNAVKRFNPRISFPTLVIDNETGVAGYDETRVRALAQS